MVLPFVSFSSFLFEAESFFFKFFICSFLRDFFHLVDSFSAINYLNIYNLYLYIYIFLYMFRFFRLRVVSLLKKNKVNSFYIKLLYFFYNFQILNFNIVSFYFIFLKKYCIWFFFLFFNMYIFYIEFLVSKISTNFVFWRPLFKKHSYYGLYRTSRTKFINETSLNKNVLKYKM